MKKVLFKTFLFVFFCSGVISLNAQNTWLQRANYAGGSYTGTCSFAIGTTGYIMTGNNTAVNNHVYAWDQSSNTWAQKDSFPAGRRTGASGVSMFGKGYLIGGEHPSNCFLNGKIGGGVCGGTFYNDIWRYAPDSDKWTQLAGFPGTYRDFAVAVADSLDSIIYYGTGNNGTVSFLRDWWGYKIPTNTWIMLDSFPSGRNSAAGFFVDGNVYVGTGDNNGKSNATADLWKYNISTDTWTQVTSMPGSAARREATTFVIGNMAYVGLGSANASTALNDLWMYDPVKDTWTQETSYPAGTLAFATGFSIGNKGYVGTGMYDDLNDTSAFWEYTPPTDSVSGINPITVSNAVNLYPNPSNGVFTIESSVVSRQSIVEIYNVLGEKVFSQYSIPNTQYSIDLSGQPSGIYFYQIISGGKTAYAGKFVIEK